MDIDNDCFVARLGSNGPPAVNELCAERNGVYDEIVKSARAAAKRQRKFSHCGSSASRCKKCSSCLSSFYCTSECQKAAWAGHKRGCREKARFMPKKEAKKEPDVNVLESKEIE
jgi:hypothetical protein